MRPLPHRGGLKNFSGGIFWLTPLRSPTVFKRARGVGVALAVVLLLFFSFQRKSIFAGFVSSFKYRRRTILKGMKNK